MKKTNRSAAAKARPEKQPMKGVDVVVRCLENEGVDTIFAYPGGSIIDMHNALTRTKKIRVVLPRHEQGGGFMAQGYARATGKVGVCMATSGPGAMNLLTAISDAYMDSVPIVAITGQVFQSLIGKNAFQETDVFGMTLPVVKHSYLVLDAKDLPQIIKEAFLIAKTGRPGPVLIDIPKDVQQSKIVPNFDAKPDLPGLQKIPLATDEELLGILRLVSASKRPVIYSGGGVISAGAAKELDEFSKYFGIPVATTLMGVGAVDPLEDKNLYWFGMHGTFAGNSAVLNSDLLLAFGTRFSDRITGAVSNFAPSAKIVHLDIDHAEQNKNVKVDLGVCGEIKNALSRMLGLAKKNKISKPDLSDWLGRVKCWKTQHVYPFAGRRRKNLTSQEAIAALYRISKGNVLVSTGVGQHQMWTPQNFVFSKPRQFISSLGAGTMGFGLPAALGAKAARPECAVVDIDGDGSFQMNIQEMATAVMENLPVKVMLLNNQFLGMVMQWEDMMYGGTRGNTELSRDPKNPAGPENISALYPDYPKIAQGYDWAARRVYKREDLDDAISEMLASKKPYLLEVVVEHDEHVLPFIPPGKSANEIIVECSSCPKFPTCEIAKRK
ncbi:MAG: biosynthetic-type acetolactate synthase large subunit [Opitutales bacterium]|nr:biosynthetic-type acetolactate synthase large subunit [Opitutales bacterium]